MRIPLLLVTSALVVAAPAIAQPQTKAPPPSESPDSPRTPLPYDRGYDKPSARTDAINAAARPAVQAANNAALAEANANTNATVTLNAADQARYDTDMSEYRAALVAHDRAVAADEAYAARQERAYADAMNAWRIQVADCRSGLRAACTAPSPRPADFW